jgi:hypothetical protein
MKGREWAPHRRAYYPRLWPIIAVATPPIALASVLLTWSKWFGFGVALIVGGLATRVRWMVWRHRHPIVSPEERAQDRMNEMRQNARWN